MLSLTMDDKGWKTNEPPPATVAQSVRVEETNRYSIVARKVVDLFNAGDYQPAPRPPVNFKSFVRRLFSWPHLVWLPPFFLAGLLYSWLMQKATKRAVGISTLGVHLCKGQNLILWDEIKEVRPFRFLHIRNLWVIRESGEKTLMHWTPLERHSDLKAAVEGSAPANHPIRKYLSLLKRI